MADGGGGIDASRNGPPRGRPGGGLMGAAGAEVAWREPEARDRAGQEPEEASIPSSAALRWHPHGRRARLPASRPPRCRCGGLSLASVWGVVHSWISISRTRWSKRPRGDITAGADSRCGLGDSAQGRNQEQ